MTPLCFGVREKFVCGVCVAALGVALLSPSVGLAGDRGQKTHEYWSTINAIGNQENPGPNAGPAAKLTAMRNMARRIDALSAKGVDPEAVEVAEKMVKLLRRAGDYLNDYGTPEKAFASGFRDGLNNDPLRSVNEANAIQRQLEEMKGAVSKTRKRLEARYDRDFPLLVQ